LPELAEKKLAGDSRFGTGRGVARGAREKSPWLKWQSRRELTVKDLLREVAEGTVDCAVANELQLADARNYYSNLATAFDIGSSSKLAWAFSMDADPELLKEAQVFFARIRQDGTLNRLLIATMGIAAGCSCWMPPLSSPRSTRYCRITALCSKRPPA